FGVRQRALKWLSIHRRFHCRKLRGLVDNTARRGDWTAPRHAWEGAGAGTNLAMIWRVSARLRAAAARRGETRGFAGVAAARRARVAARVAGTNDRVARNPAENRHFFRGCLQRIRRVTHLA